MAAASWGGETRTILQGQYALLEQLGEHAGNVYRAERRRDKRGFAIRMWKASSAASAMAFVDIARAANQVRHPVLANVEVCGREPDDTCFIVSEYVAGQALDSWADRVGIPPLPLIVDLICRLCSGLQAASSVGLHHDAINPQNVRVQVFGEGPAQRVDVKLLDLGVPSFLRPPVPSARAARFMAPEQLATLLTSHVRPAATAAMNVYSLGCLAYYLCTGGAPFQGGSVDDLREAHAQQKLVLPSRINPRVGPQLDAVITRALAISPQERYPDVVAFAEALRAVDLSSAGSGVRSISVPPMAAGVFAARKALDATPPSIVTRLPRARNQTPLIDSTKLERLLIQVDAELAEPDELLIETEEPTSNHRVDSLHAHSVPARSLPAAPRHRLRTLALALCAGLCVFLAFERWSPASAPPAAPRNASGQTTFKPEPPTEAHAPSVREEPVLRPAPVRNVVEPQVMVKPLEEAPAPDVRVLRARPRADVRTTLPSVQERVSERKADADATQLRIAPRPQPMAAGSGARETERAAIEPPPEPQSAPPSTSSALPSSPASISQPAIETPRPPVTPAAPKHALPLRARVSIVDVQVRGSLPSALMRRAVERLRPALSDCYARAAVAAKKNGFGVLQAEVDIDENARARNARSSGAALPGLDRCVADAIGRTVSERAPDTGTVKASWKVVFEP